MKNKKKQQVFQSTTFTYFSSKSELVPDSVRFIQDGKKYEVIFNTDLGWTSNIMRFGKPHQQDMILGIIIGDEKNLEYCKVTLLLNGRLKQLHTKIL